jgi:hypothetical protein
MMGRLIPTITYPTAAFFGDRAHDIFWAPSRMLKQMQLR